MYDAIIIGGGVSGLTAGIYLARAGFKTLILEKETIGGQIASASLVENYPGFSSINGALLAANMYDQVIKCGAELEIERVTSIRNDKRKKVITEEGEYEAKTIIIATGAKHRKLGLETEEKFIGNGIHFCVACDGAFYKDGIVAVIGGANTAVSNALALSEIAKKVYLICIEESLICENSLEENLKTKSNVEVIYKTAVESFNGEDALCGITIKTENQLREIKLDGVFESIGLDAESELADDLLDKNKFGYITSDNGKTSAAGIFTAGDCREKEIRQLTIAAADGTVAAYAAIKYLKENSQ